MWTEVYVHKWFALRFLADSCIDVARQINNITDIHIMGKETTSLLGFQWLFLQEIGKKWPVL